MKKLLKISVGTIVLCLLATNFVSAQDKRIRLVKGRKLILKGMVREGADKSYTFKAQEGQQLTVKLIGSDAAFTLYASHPFDVESIIEDTQSWSGKLPANQDGEYKIAMISNYKVADYTLIILLK
ncbi:MAG: hypothetical protein M3R67_06790 [Acidobacteriota bacterium]|nr:hypothetical protein [Acidobacteriota bacterium]